MVIDTHCHLTYEGIHDRLDEVIEAARRAGVDRMITIGSTPTDSPDAAALAERIDGVYATAGLHPHYAHLIEQTDALKASLSQLLDTPPIWALGEMGLDWHYPEPAADVQREVFAAQLELLHDYPNCPAVIHNREATDDTLAMLREANLAGERFDFHCFTGSRGELDRILDFGAMVGITGIATFKNASEVAEASDRIPLDRLLIETDSPFCSPEPYRKVKPNEPRYVADVARFLAHRRGMSLDNFTAAVDANAERFFGLPPGP